MTHIRLQGIDKRFRHRPILQDLELDMVGGECALLRGANGAGKSTLLRIIAGLEKPERGRVSLNRGAAENWSRARKALLQAVVYLHQNPYLFDGTVLRNLGYPLRDPPRERKQRLQEALNWADLDHLAARKVQGLSGGERQRVALARAWLCRPRILLLDEPTANLDSESRSRCLEMMRQMRDQEICLLIASHDPQHFGDLAQRTLRLENGRLHSSPNEQPTGNEAIPRPESQPASPPQR